MTESKKSSENTKKEKTCSTCKEEKPLDEFYSHKKYKDGKKRECKDCENLTSRLRYEKKKASGETSIKNHRDTNRAGHLKRTFGITVEEYDELLIKQDFCCAICKRHQNEFDKRFSVDHAHSESEWVPEGMIRGLLCFQCNHLVVGRLTDASIFENASKYLKQHTGWRVPVEMTKGPKRKRKNRKRKV